MSRFKSLKEVSLKKKLFISFIIIAIVVAIVFVVIKFGFPDPDLDRPYELAYEVGADSMTKSRFDSAFDFFDTSCDDEGKKDSAALRNLNSFYLARLSVNKTTNRNVDRLLFALSEVQDMNKVDKKIKHLEELKDNVDSAKNDVLAYCENQVMPYKESTTEYSRISDYFSNFAKKFTIYLKSMRDFENYLEEIIETSTHEGVSSNHLTHVASNLNNKRLSLCVDACEKKFVKGESATINAPILNIALNSTTTMFELKESALKSFVSNKNEITQKLDNVTKVSWLDDWLKVLGTIAEKNFVNTLDKAEYNNFKRFISLLFSISMVDYPEPVEEPVNKDEPQETYKTTSFDEMKDSQFLEVA